MDVYTCKSSKNIINDVQSKGNGEINTVKYNYSKKYFDTKNIINDVQSKGNGEINTVKYNYSKKYFDTEVEGPEKNFFLTRPFSYQPFFLNDYN